MSDYQLVVPKEGRVPCIYLPMDAEMNGKNDTPFQIPFQIQYLYKQYQAL